MGASAREIIKKEVVRLGERYQLASKETSFVAVETRSGDRFVVIIVVVVVVAVVVVVDVDVFFYYYYFLKFIYCFFSPKI